MDKAKTKPTARQYLIATLAYAVFAFLALMLAAAVIAGLRYAGVEVTERGETWVRCIVLGLLIGFGPRFVMRRLGMKV